MIPSGAKHVGREQAEKMNPQPATLRSRNLLAAVMPISSKNRHSAP